MAREGIKSRVPFDRVAARLWPTWPSREDFYYKLSVPLLEASRAFLVSRQGKIGSQEYGLSFFLAGLAWDLVLESMTLTATFESAASVPRRAGAKLPTIASLSAAAQRARKDTSNLLRVQRIYNVLADGACVSIPPDTRRGLRAGQLRELLVERGASAGDTACKEILERRARRAFAKRQRKNIEQRLAESPESYVLQYFAQRAREDEALPADGYVPRPRKRD
jgi:hypothetical protein